MDTRAKVIGSCVMCGKLEHNDADNMPERCPNVVIANRTTWHSSLALRQLGDYGFLTRE